MWNDVSVQKILTRTRTALTQFFPNNENIVSIKIKYHSMPKYSLQNGF